MKKKVEKTLKIEDGKHLGKIVGVEYKTKPYEYVDIVIQEAELDIPLKCGVPFTITDNTALGNILKNFGATLEVDSEIEIEDYLKKDTEVQFITMMEETKKGKFARIQPMSLKPKE